MISVALFSLLFLGAPEEELDELQALQITIRAAVRKIEPCVVRITTVGGIRRITVPDRFKEKMSVPERPRENDPDTPEERESDRDQPSPEGRTPRFKNEFQKMLALPGFKKAEGPTTGLILSENGYIVTSAWNFESKPQATVVTTHDGKSHAATLLGIDRAAGLALLKIDATGLPVPEFLDPDKVRVGAWAFGLGRSMTPKGVALKYGIISARNRIEGNALQTDVATSPSNYGGPLIDITGRVYGIIVPLGSRGQETNPNWYDSGIGFAAPVRDPDALVERLGEEGVELLPAFLGVQTDQERTEPGARVTQIVPGKPADKAGLKKGDIVLEVDGRKIKNAFSLRFEVGRRRAGDKVTLLVERGGKQLKMAATLARRPKPDRSKERLPVQMPGMPEKPKRPGD